MPKLSAYNATNQTWARDKVDFNQINDLKEDGSPSVITSAAVKTQILAQHAAMKTWLQGLKDYLDGPVYDLAHNANKTSMKAGLTAINSDMDKIIQSLDFATLQIKKSIDARLL